MSALTYKGYSARVEFDAEDMLLVGRLAGIDDIITFHATSMDELADVFRESVDDYIETCAKIGKKPEKAYSGKLMLMVTSSCTGGTPVWFSFLQEAAMSRTAKVGSRSRLFTVRK